MGNASGDNGVDKTLWQNFVSVDKRSGIYFSDK